MHRLSLGSVRAREHRRERLVLVGRALNRGGSLVLVGRVASTLAAFSVLGQVGSVVSHVSVGPSVGHRRPSAYAASHEDMAPR